MTTPRERARERTIAEIRELAWRHLESGGAASLSLRAIARDLGVVSSAIYRYVPSRDELLTDLIIEGYQDLAVAAEEAESAARARGEEHPRQRWLATAHAMRRWALRRPAAWALLYGSPVPDYDAPAERTNDAGTRTMVQFVRIAVEAQADVPLTPSIPSDDISAPLAAGLVALAGQVDLAGVDSGGVLLDPRLIAGTILGWQGVIAAISSEVFEQVGPNPTGQPREWAEVSFRLTADIVGLPR